MHTQACQVASSAVKNVVCMPKVLPFGHPVDLGHNFVLAHDACNGAKGMMLAAEEYLGCWTEQNQLHGNAIQAACVGANIRSDLEASLQIARWAYGQAFAAQSMVWVRAKELRLLGERLGSVLARR